MKIVNGFDLLAYAKEKKLLLPAFNTTNLEMTKAIIKGLNAVHLPGMVQISSNNLHLSNPEVIAYMMREFLKGTDTPVGLHLDHGKSFDDVKACVDAGFNYMGLQAGIFLHHGGCLPSEFRRKYKRGKENSGILSFLSCSGGSRAGSYHGKRG